MELTREQVEYICKFLVEEHLSKDAATILAHDAALRQRAVTAENELCTAKDQIPPDLDGYPLSVVLIKLNDERRVLRERAEAAERELEEYRSIAERIGAEKAVSRMAELETRVRELITVNDHFEKALKEIACGTSAWERDDMIDCAVATLSAVPAANHSVDANKMAKPLAWTTDRPKEAGLYCNEGEDGTIQPLILVHGSHHRLEVNCQGDTELENYTGRWAGPIPLPKEA